LTTPGRFKTVASSKRRTGGNPPPFLSLDFIYHPSRNVERDLRYFAEVIGARVHFAVEGMGARVAAVELASSGPLLLLADHLEGETPVLVYRVASLSRTMSGLERRGWKREERFEIPHGPICSFRIPGGQRVAIYQLTRPKAAEHFEGRRDF
jgi:hypothetical protein